VLVNFATLQNNATLTNSVGGTITNSATLVNNLGATLTNNGTLTNQAGATFTNNGTFTNAGTFTNNGTLKGTGTILGDIANSGTIAPGNSIGTMTITGNYTHDAGATYQVEVNAAGQSDKLVVTGTATLNGGTVAVLAESGTYSVSTNYTILSAGSVTGTFSSVTSNLAFLTPSLSYDATNVFLALTRNSTSFADVALPGNERAVASAIDRISPYATGDMAYVINTMLGLSADGARRAYDQMGGITHNSLAGAVFFSFSRYMDILSDRMGSLLTGRPSSGSANRSVMLASRSDIGSDAGNTILGALGNMEYRERPQRGFWVRGYAGNGDRHGSDISSRYNYDLAGIVAGFDRNVSDPLLLGATLGYTRTKATMKDLSDTATVSSYQGSLYGMYDADPWYAGSIITYGYNRFDTSRDISFGVYHENGQRRLRRPYPRGARGRGCEAEVVLPDVIPVASLTGIRFTRDGFRERDAGSLSLDADSSTASSLVGSLGLKLRKEYKMASGMMVPEVKAAWLHEFVSDDYLLSAAFAGYPASTFTVRGDRPLRDSINTGLLLTWEIPKHMSLYLSYDAVLSGDQSGQLGSVGIRYRW
jgi:outer membrane autotransporter protein